MESVQVNWGTLTEIPEVCINRFGGAFTSAGEVNLNNRAFFMTHIDDETVTDFFSSNFLVKLDSDHDGTLRLFLHEMAYYFLIYWTSSGNLAHTEAAQERLLRVGREGKIVFMEKDIPIQLRFYKSAETHESSTHYQVTGLSAGHGVGSIMLMFESISRSDPALPETPNENLRLLYTGNCRLHLKDLKRAKSLYQLGGIGSRKQFTHVYLDTKYFIENVEELPSRRAVTESVVKLMTQTMRRNDCLIFGINTLLDTADIKFLQVLCQMTGEHLHVPESLRSFLALFPHLKVYSTYVPFTRLHYNCDAESALLQHELCYPIPSCVWRGPFEQMIEVSLGCIVHSESGTSFNKTLDELNWNFAGYHHYSQRCPEDGSEIIRGIYCTQLSRFEAARFINFLGVDLAAVTPLYRGADYTPERLSALIKATCNLENVNEEPCDIQNDYSGTSHDFTLGLI